MSTFFSKVGNKCPTIVLIKSKAGFKFGGYTTNTWTGTGYKKDELAFLFSIDNKKKYQISKINSAHAICINSGSFAFGGGHDLSIFEQFKSNTSHYSNFPTTYSGGDITELTGGQYNFIISECEIYYVEFI